MAESLNLTDIRLGFLCDFISMYNEKALSVIYLSFHLI